MIDEQDNSFYLADEVIKEVESMRKELESIKFFQKQVDQLNTAVLALEKYVKEVDNFIQSLTKVSETSEKDIIARVSSAPRPPSAPEVTLPSPRCPVCGKEMKKRESIHGEFWGCTGYPKCKATINIAKREHDKPYRQIIKIKSEDLI